MNKRNEEQRLFILPCGSGFSCLGFDVCHEWSTALAKELGEPLPDPATIGQQESLDYYHKLCGMAEERNRKTGWRSASQLTPELIGLERMRVEVRHRWKPDGAVEVRRFIVGKSSGYIPCHLEIKTRRSIGGGAVCLGEILSVRVLKN